MANDQAKLENARRMRGIYFIDPEDEEYQETIKTCKAIVGSSDGSGPCRARIKTQTSRARRKLQRGQECPTRFKRQSTLEKWKFRESTRQRMEPTSRKGHEDHIAGKEHHSMNHSNLVNKFISIQKAMRIPDAILFKGSFTRDERNHLLRLLNVMNFSMFSCSHFFL